jgi:hypothetical protein
MVIVRPAMLIVADRGVGSALGATVYWSHELPLPVAPAGIVIHVSLLDAAQLHPEVVLMNALLVEPVAPTVTVVGDREKLQPL